MEITTELFALFFAAVVVLYYLLPDRQKPKVLLLAGLFFLGTYQPWGIVFVIAATGIIWKTGLLLERVSEDEKKDKKQIKARRKQLLQLCLFLLVGILAVLKYIGTYVGNYLDMSNPLGILIPVGLSYYTLEAIGYVLDVYWMKIPAERNFLNLFTFLTYFPSLLQGPINRYQPLSEQILEKPHPFNSKNLKFGVQRMLWGYFKVIVVSNLPGLTCFSAFMEDTPVYGWAAVYGLVAFGFKLYANFSGGIDLVCGASQCLGIDLPENFRQPFFSKSLGEFWRRWHMSLGKWMKDYVFIPLAVSGPIIKLKKAAKKKLPRKLVNRLPIALADVVVFLIVGIWHGTGINYAIWGLYNGLILGISEVLTDVYASSREKLHIQEKSPLWSGFCIFRTFVLVTIGWATDCAVTAGGIFTILKNMCFLNLSNPAVFNLIGLEIKKVLVFVGVMLVVDILHEKNISIRDFLDRKPYWLQVLFWAVFIVIIMLFDAAAGNGGLMYAAF